MFISALIHPKPKSRSEVAQYNVFICEEEMDRFMKDYLHKPVFLNHEKNTHAGALMEFKRGKIGDVFVILYLDERFPYGKQAMEGVQNGTYKSISWGYTADFTTKGRRISKINPFEVSLVEKGEIDRSRILCYGEISGGELKKIKISQSAFNQIYPKKMATSENTQPAKTETSVLDDLLKTRGITVEKLVQVYDRYQQKEMKVLQDFLDPNGRPAKIMKTFVGNEDMVHYYNDIEDKVKHGNMDVLLGVEILAKACGKMGEMMEREKEANKEMSKPTQTEPRPAKVADVVKPKTDFAIMEERFRLARESIMGKPKESSVSQDPVDTDSILRSMQDKRPAFVSE
jgi:hypothetical protein